MTASEEKFLSGRVFAVLYLSFNTLIAAFWTAKVYVLRVTLFPPMQQWTSDSAFRQATSFWKALGVADLAEIGQNGFIMGVVPSLLFAALMMWNLERLCAPRQLRPILRRTVIVALAVMGLLAGFLLLNGITPFSHEPESPPYLGLLQYGFITGCLPAGVGSGWILYRFLKTMDERKP